METLWKEGNRLLEENDSIQKESDALHKEVAGLSRELDDAQLQIHNLQQTLSSFDAAHDAKARVETLANDLRAEIKVHRSENEGLRRKLQEAAEESRRAAEKEKALSTQIAAAQVETQRATDEHRAQVEESAKKRKA
ncbi:hypothetical protein CYLTODRAFT_5388 [Cylindrobasidium torrendii FP15055 ss-10]|uniref:Uncharacterized protein n=1 Tax=Cylindrobasidium torrendii FP15055 ss-10 TaxID=1314674 RepID=A0A0D7BXQ2_9AGAR|nr:hypothetical protein CYLTODRAFT_5388 [Cylindrobasidium torrendii FP15055 ss-10]